MPFPLLAHQAVVLPLKLRWPAAFSGTALCIGSIAPDLEYLFRDHGPGIGHSLRGQIAFCLPLTLLATYATARFVAPLLAPILRVERFSLPPRTRRAWLPLVYSGLLGSASHLVLDGLTHRGGWGARMFPRLADDGGVFTSRARILQYALTVTLSLATIALIYLWRRPRVAPRAVPARTLWAGVGAVLGGLFGARSAAAVLRAPILYFAEGRLHAWGYWLFSVCVFAFVGVALAGAVLALLDTRRARADASP